MTQIVRKSVSTLVLVALLSSAAPQSVAAQAQGGQGQDAQDQGSAERRRQPLCRQPAALPVLAPEPGYSWDDNQQESDVRRTRDGRYSRDASPLPAPPPPPPPPPMAMPSAVPESDGDTGEVVVTASRRGGTAAPSARAGSARGDTPTESAAPTADRRLMPPPRPYPSRPPRPPRPPQGGTLTAGEHDDLLNPQLYDRYVRRSDLAQQIPDLPRLDTRRVLSVRVTDGNGRPAAFANVTVTCADGNSITLATPADGVVTFFPDLDRLGRDVTLTARYNGRAAGEARQVRIAQSDGEQSLRFVAATRWATPVRKLDLVFAIDTTGSMGDEIRYLQAELDGIISRVRQTNQNIDVRVGFVFYRDTQDDYVTRTIPLGSNLQQMQAVLNRQSAGGGGDYPEAMDQALIRAVGLDWRADAAKTLILVADAPPHDERFGRTWAAAEVARAQRIHIVPVAASGVADRAEYAMRTMAALTQSRYLFLTDDSGVGNAHAEPSVDCYRVTRLNALLRRVITSQVSGRRIEPDEQEIIRTVGDYDNGRCILPANFSDSQ